MVRLILGDQLNRHHSWFSEQLDDITYAFFECYDEATYATHHIQKVVGIFAGMRAFATALQAQGHKVHYGSLGQTLPSLGENLQKLCKQLNTECTGSALNAQSSGCAKCLTEVPDAPAP